MSIKSIIAALAVVGSSSVALAAPSNYRATATYPQTSIHSPTAFVLQGQQAQPDPCAPAPKREVTLGTESRIWKGTETFRVGAYKGQFETVKLESQGLKSRIDNVTIRFANGRSQTVSLDRYITAANPCLTIDLAGNNPRTIESITVTAANARQSSFSIVAV